MCDIVGKITMRTGTHVFKSVRLEAGKYMSRYAPSQRGPLTKNGKTEGPISPSMMGFDFEYKLGEEYTAPAAPGFFAFLLRDDALYDSLTILECEVLPAKPFLAGRYVDATLGIHMTHPTVMVPRLRVIAVIQASWTP